MKDPAAIDPEVKARLDEAFEEQLRARQAQQDARTREVEALKDRMEQQGRQLDQIVLPALRPLAEYLKGRGIEADVQSSRGPSGTTTAALVWGPLAKDLSVTTGRPVERQNCFKTRIEPHGGLKFFAALRGDPLAEQHGYLGDITSSWVAKSATDWITKSLAGL